MINKLAFMFIVTSYTWCVENGVAVILNSQYKNPEVDRLRGRMLDKDVDKVERGTHIEQDPGEPHVLLSHRWPKAKKAGCPKDIQKFRNHVALVVMWNVALDQDQATVLSELYAPWFADVVHVGGPDASCNPENDEERGFGHAMYKCYAQAAWHLSKKPKIEGVLFIADDVAFRPGDLPYLGLNHLRRIWLPAWSKRGTRTWKEARAEGWGWYDNPLVGLDALKKLFNEHSNLATHLYGAFNCSDGCFPDHYVGDVFYLPRWHAGRFASLASTFYKYKVFTEIAMPIIVTLLGKEWAAVGNDLPEAFDGEEIMEGDPLSYRNPNFVLAWDPNANESLAVRGSSPADDTLQNLMVVSPESISLLHPVKKSDNATMELWRHWLSQSGPCNVMPRVEEVLDQLPEPRPKLESWLPQILDVIEPVNVTPLAFRDHDLLLPQFQRTTPADVSISPQASTNETISLLRRHRLMSRLPAKCKGASFWAILTTVNPVEKGIKKLDDLPDGWCTVVVADLKTPRHKNGSYFPGAKRVFYLSPEEQKGLPFKTLEYIPWNSFARKNVGYLFAAAMGAETIYDTDDDNILKSSPPLLHSDSSTMSVRSMTSEQGTGNVYSKFGGGAIWPRGTSLRAVSSTPTVHKVNVVDTRKLAIQQSLVDGDPDVDAIYRLGARVPEDGVTFKSSSIPLMLERGVSAPTNSQSTTFLKSAFPLLLLPTTVHPRVADIWRGYFALPALWAANLTVAFTAPKVHQARNKHDLAEDLWAEWPLYHKVGSLVSYIQDMISSLPAQANPGQNTVAHVASQVYRDMYERGFVEAYDMNVSSAFLQDIQALPELEASYAL